MSIGACISDFRYAYPVFSLHKCLDSVRLVLCDLSYFNGLTFQIGKFFCSKGFLSRHVQSTGSGFIIDDTGHVITNAHVVGYRSDVFVHLSDGRSYPGRVLAVDVSSDLALVQVSHLSPFICW